MKDLKMHELCNQINEIDIAKLENALNIKLPVLYKKFLLKYNGGYSEKNTFPSIEEFSTEENTGSIDRFLALYTDEKVNNIIDVNKSMIDRIPREFIFIAHAVCGDKISMCIKGVHYGKIYFWDHNWESEDDEEATNNNMYFIAGNFENFINSLYETELLEDKDGKDLWIYRHDKYSLSVCSEIKKCEKVVKEFFNKAPKEVDEFIIKEFSINKELLLSFQTEGKEYFRRLDKEGKIIEEGVNTAHTKNPPKNGKNNHEEKGSEE